MSVLACELHDQSGSHQQKFGLQVTLLLYMHAVVLQY